MSYQLKIELLSDTTFGRGDGVAGVIDQEVEYEPETGLPFIRGRTLKGLLVEECANILFALGNPKELVEAAKKLFGEPGSSRASRAMMRVGNAQLPSELRRVVAADLDANKYSKEDVLESLTDIRRQTGVDSATDAPDKGSLRTMRVVIRGTIFTADLEFDVHPEVHQLMLLSACVKAVRRGGIGRNRGRGRLKLRLHSDGTDRTEDFFAKFEVLAKALEVPHEGDCL